MISRKLLQSPDLAKDGERYNRAVILVELMAGAPKNWLAILRTYAEDQFEIWLRAHRPDPTPAPCLQSTEILELEEQGFSVAEARRLLFQRWLVEDHV